jgi:hypothetical protein
MAEPRLHKVLITPLVGRIDGLLEGISIELRGEDRVEGNINDGADEFETESYNLAIAPVASTGIDNPECVGLIGSSSRCVRPDNGLGLGDRTLGGADWEVGGTGFGFERLLARPNSSFAADATVQLAPPMLVARVLSLGRIGREFKGPPGPPIPEAPGLVDTSDAILVKLSREAGHSVLGADGKAFYKDDDGAFL